MGHKPVNFLCAQTIGIQQLIESGQIAGLDDDLALAIDDDEECRRRLQRRQIGRERHANDAVRSDVDVAGHQFGGQRIEVAIDLRQ